MRGTRFQACRRGGDGARVVRRRARAVAQPDLPAAGSPAGFARPRQQRSGARRPDPPRRGRGQPPAIRGRPAGRAIAPHGLRKLRLFLDLQQSAAAMRRPHPADRPAAQYARSPAKPARAAQWRHHRTRRAAAVAADRARRQWLRRAIPLGRAARPARRLLRPPVRRQWRPVLGAIRANGRHLPHHLRAHLRRLLFPDFVRDHAGSFPRRRADLPTHVPGGGSLRSTPITTPARK